MQAPRSDYLTPFEKTEMLAAATDLLDDSEVLTAITLKSFTSTTVDHEAGTYTPTETSNTVNALRRTVGAGEVGLTDLQVGDRVYWIERGDLTTEIQSVDTVVDGADVLDVVSWSSDVLDWFYLVHCRDAGA